MRPIEALVPSVRAGPLDFVGGGEDVGDGSVHSPPKWSTSRVELRFGWIEAPGGSTEDSGRSAAHLLHCGEQAPLRSAGRSANSTGLTLPRDADLKTGGLSL